MPGKTPSRITIEVTEKDIERAHVNDSYKCVVSQAIARTVPGATNIETDTQTIRFTVDGERRLYLTPYAVQGYVIAFDAGDAIEPFAFQLREPRRVARRVRTEAGKNADREARRASRESRVSTPAEGPAKEKAPAKGETSTKDDRKAAKAAYAEARKADAHAQTRVGKGPKATPRVFKRKRRAYGHRLLRINQQQEADE